VVALLGGGGAAAYFLGLFGGGGEAAAAQPHGKDGDADHDDNAGHDGEGADAHGGGRKDVADASHAEDGGQPEGGGKATPAVLFVDLPDLLVNLRSDGKRLRFLKLRVALEVESEKAGDGVKALTPRVMDSFQMYLRALSVDEVQGSGGMQKLKEEMMARVNLAIEPHRVSDVLFKEMLVQ
jgi:flagellar FliL protein